MTQPGHRPCAHHRKGLALTYFDRWWPTSKTAPWARSISACTVVRIATPGRTTSGSTATDKTGQYSGFPFHRVPTNSGQEPLMIFHSGPVDFTIVEHFGQPVCMARICVAAFSFSSMWVARSSVYLCAQSPDLLERVVTYRPGREVTGGLQQLRNQLFQVLQHCQNGVCSEQGSSPSSGCQA
jgi:hypothetical protein